MNVHSSCVHRTGVLSVAVALVTGCSADVQPLRVNVEDSAGVRIVTNPPGSVDAAPAWTLSSEPVVEIGGGASPEVPLYRVSAVASLADGWVAVGTERPPRVLVFEADGGLAGTLGREGEGPGEFRRVGSVVPLGAGPPSAESPASDSPGLDSLAVWDPDRRRLSVFSGEGRFLREADLSELVPLSPMAAATLDGLTAVTHLLPSTSGSLVLFSVGMTGPGGGVRRVEAPSYRIAPHGELLVTFGPFPGEETFYFGAGEGGTFPYPFSAGTYGATVGDALVVGTAESPELRLYDSTGALGRVVRWPDHDRTLGGPFLTDWNDFVDDWLDERSPGEATVLREMWEEVPLRDRFPAYEDVIATDAGQIWVGAYAGEHITMYPPRNLPPPERRWLVFDADGALVATVGTPEGFQPHAVRDGRVWGVYMDELEVESVRAYEVQR